nr:hypothetical protein [Tabrizicola oligotrophica]
MSIRSLHEAIRIAVPGARVLEVSSASEDALGEKLSAFNLTFHTRGRGREISVESAFQASKVFENGGPYTDLMDARPLDAKRDPRLQSSGRLIRFSFSGQNWALEPLTAFYDWVYINALHLQRELAEAVMAYDAFTDIAFNPEKSINCQAGSVALYVSLKRRGLLEEVLGSRDNYLTLISGINGTGVRNEDGSQARLL